MSETNGGQRARSRSSSSSSSSSSDDENKNLTKEEKKQRKKEKKLLKKQKRKERGRSSSSSSSSSDEEYKNLSKDEKKKRKKEKKAMKKKQKEAKKEEAKPIAEAKPIQGVTAQKADVNVPTAQDSGGVAKADAEASKGRGQDDDSETGKNANDEVNTINQDTNDEIYTDSQNSPEKENEAEDITNNFESNNKQNENLKSNADNDLLSIDSNDIDNVKEDKYVENLKSDNKLHDESHVINGANEVTNSDDSDSNNLSSNEEQTNIESKHDPERYKSARQRDNSEQDNETLNQDTDLESPTAIHRNKESVQEDQANTTDIETLQSRDTSQKAEILNDRSDNEGEKDKLSEKSRERRNTIQSFSSQNSSTNGEVHVETPTRKIEDNLGQSSESPKASSGTKQQTDLHWENIPKDNTLVDSDGDEKSKSQRSISPDHNSGSRQMTDDDDQQSDADSVNSTKIDVANKSEDENDRDENSQRKEEKPDENQLELQNVQTKAIKNEEGKHVVIVPGDKKMTAKDKPNVAKTGRQSKSPRPQESRNQGSSSPRQQNYRRMQEERKFRRPVHSAPASSQNKINRPKTSDGRRCMSRGKKTETKQKKSEESAEASQGKQKKEYKTEELRRLQEILKKERSHIRKPRQRAHFPFVWTSLEPYYNTQTAAFLIDLSSDDDEPETPEPTKSRRSPKLRKSRTRINGDCDRQPEPLMRSRTISTPEEFRHSYLSRNTAQGLCDPWIDLRMDHDILPKISSGTRTSTRGSHSQDKSKEKKKEKEAKEKEKEKKPFEGSTRLPKFPVVPFHAGKENATQRFPYQDIPKFRQEMDQRFSLHAPKKIEEDYKRTKEDFYRMELDRLDQVHPMNRPHMRKAYFAYLQNTPGSKKAITECVRSLDGSPQQQKTGSAQKAN